MNLRLFKLSVCACLAGTLWLPASGAAAAKKLAIGSPAGELRFKDIRFAPRTLKDLAPAKAYVIAFTTTECPLVARYLPRLKELSSQFQEQGAQFLAINVGPD